MKIRLNLLRNVTILLLLFWCHGSYAFSLFGGDDSKIELIQSQLETLTITVKELEKSNALLKDQASIREMEYSETVSKLTRVANLKPELIEVSKQLASEKLRVANSIKSLNIKLSSLNQKSGVLETTLQEHVDSFNDNKQQLLGKQNKVAEQLSGMQGNVIQLKQDVSDRISIVDSSLSNVSKDVSLRSIYIAITLLILAIALLWFKRALSMGKITLAEEMSKTKSIVESEYNALDLKLSEILESQINTTALNKQGSELNDRDEVDHSLPLKVATEIHRMRKRVARLPEKTKGIKPLEKALERLEESLGEQDYEIIEMLGDEYDEGMTVNQTFILDESMSPNKRIITNVIKPQVNFKGVLIQVADIEVSMGE